MTDTPQQMAERLEAMLRDNAAAIDLEPAEVELIRAAAEMLRACPSVEARQEAYELAVLGLIFREDAIRMRELLGLPVEP